MPKIQWTNLPLALRDHLFDRLQERKITAKTSTNSSCGANRNRMRLTVKGVRTSAPSRSAAKESIPKHFC
jgi:hypothetical protein